jgi:hypothetical protein
MSWDVYLTDDRGHTEGDWNYTHNTNRMIAEALRKAAGIETPQGAGLLGRAIGPTWWDKLDGATGAEGREYLTLIIAGLESDPATFRAMNPPNGWGDYDRLLELLREMRDRVPDWPCVWKARG